jgi:peptidoglycan hydrolase-like protein with peptidoglycan-binding domain
MATAPATARQPLRPMRPAGNTIQWVQVILNRVAGEALEVDGRLGKNTRAALVRFQERHGLASGGTLDGATETALLQVALEWFRQTSLFPVKGSLDDRTREELCRYQRGVRVEASGKLGEKTRAAMLHGLQSSAPPRAGGAPPAPAPGLPALDGPRVPAGFRLEARGRGLIRYSEGRLDRTLDGLRKRGLLALSDDDLDTFQRIANIETLGGVQGINTWDSAVVSSGFMQWTLQHGKLQAWIAHAPGAFARHGIALDEGCPYQWGEDTQVGIQGASDKDALRWSGWAERFYRVGLDEEALVAEVALARKLLDRHLDGLRRRLGEKGIDQAGYGVFQRHYDASLAIRGMFQAAYNNLPGAAADAVCRALAASKPGDDASAFQEHLIAGIRLAFSARDKRQRGENMTTKTLQGARL